MCPTPVHLSLLLALLPPSRGTDGRRAERRSRRLPRWLLRASNGNPALVWCPGAERSEWKAGRGSPGVGGGGAVREKVEGGKEAVARKSN